jgi:chemotaxis protein CheD
MNNSAPLRNIVLHPGEVHVGDARDRVITLLGSCVSITLWHPQKKIGAMSHYLLSTRNRTHASGKLDGRYGDEAIQLMFEGLLARAVAPEQCVAKIFGGGHMFAGLWRNETRDIGRKNGDAARSMLGSLHIPVVSESLYGERFRKIYFDIASGVVWASRTAAESPATAPRTTRNLHAGQAAARDTTVLPRACPCRSGAPCDAHSD